jgi:DedD protein
MAEERRPRRREGRGLLAVLFGTALLGVIGFGLGIVAGLVLEEPSLLLDYVTGRTTSTKLEPSTAAPSPSTSAAADTAPAAPVAAAPPPVSAPPQAPRSDEAAPAAVERSEPPAPAPVASAPPAAKPEPKPIAPPAPATTPPPAHAGQTGYSVQVGALADSAGAEQLAARLQKRGYTVYVSPSTDPSAKRWRVRVGPVATREEAQRLAAELERDKLPTWVLAEGQH